MIGLRGITEDRLAPSGYVRVHGELWQAEVVQNSPPIEKGEKCAGSWKSWTHSARAAMKIGSGDRVKPAIPPEGRRIKRTAGKPARQTAGNPKLLTEDLGSGPPDGRRVNPLETRRVNL